jgi:hypothetical protein
MAEDSPEQQPDVPRDAETGTILSVAKIKARDLTAEHVGKFVVNLGPDGGAKAPARILKVQQVTEGDAPGVSVLLRVSALRDGTPAHNVSAHVPFDHEFELIQIIGY